MAIKTRANNASKAKSRLVGIVIAMTIVIFVCIMTAVSAAENKKVVSIVRVKSDSPLSASSLITEDKIEQYDMYYKEFKNYGTIETSDGNKMSTIVQWKDRNAVLGRRYSAYYQRGGTALFWDSTVKEQTRKNSYLYSMTGELLNIQMTTTSDFGDMVVPGDTLNIRATYEDTVYNITTEEDYMLAGNDSSFDGEATKTVTEPLLSEVTILDMLNGEGKSIFDIYYDYISSSKQRQQALLASDDFLSSVQPQSILLECTAEEVEHYMKLQAAGASYQMTLLPRTSSSSITDSLSEIQKALSGASGN